MSPSSYADNANQGRVKSGWVEGMPVAYFAGCLAMISDKPEDITNAQTCCDKLAEIVQSVSEPGVFA